MGQRGEIFSTRIFTDEGRKTYFFNVKENRYHDIYLNIVESRKTENDFRRSSIIVFREDIDNFLKILNKSIRGLRSRISTVDEHIEVGGGRREYRCCRAPRGRRSLLVTETREDSSGFRRERIYVAEESIDLFMKGLMKALSVIEST